MPTGQILIVDDTATNIAVLNAWLQAQGYSVFTASDGPTALDLAAQHLPDLILLDIVMPDMDGYEVCERLKASDQTRDIPVIFVSAIETTIDIVRAFRVGGVDYITKPFRVEELLARVETQIRLHHQQQELAELRAGENARLENLNRLKDEFVNTVSHDLKNPIGVILGSTMLLKEMGTLNADEDARSLLNAIDHNAQFMLELVSNLLDLARIEAGMNLNLEIVSLYEILHQTFDSFFLQAHRRELDLTMTQPDEDCALCVDRTQFSQVLSNLLGNAIKYTPGGGQIQLTAVVGPDMVTISVADNGLGIPEKDLPHLFEKFYRVARYEHQTEKGSGLGLSIAKAIIEQHGGQIHVESHVGTGSMFSIMLPRPHNVSEASGIPGTASRGPQAL